MDVRTLVGLVLSVVLFAAGATMLIRAAWSGKPIRTWRGWLLLGLGLAFVVGAPYVLALTFPDDWSLIGDALGALVLTALGISMIAGSRAIGSESHRIAPAHSWATPGSHQVGWVIFGAMIIAGGIGLGSNVVLFLTR